MSPDFENTMLRHYATGKIIRTADGKPMLYKHFINDLPDDDVVEKVAKTTDEERLDYHLKFNIPIPKYLEEAAAEEAKAKGDR